ncbi:Mov34 family protein [Methanosarcina barkeri str. Wiesmoor]|uniref:Mov34 family protein n=2 Tax=Methanosarcina barkeri TaxID=2208 RepID=A0A0E3LLA7_METBA|nr:Mov34 family protein [Methanosarcina barkeri str. Wiesmoor]
MAPQEFAGLLQEKDGIITEVLILPGTESSDSNAVLRLYMMPNIKAAGSVHSHPGPNRSPSQADLLLFSKTGNCHIIVGRPYSSQSWTCYNREGKVIDLPVLDVEFEDYEEI